MTRLDTPNGAASGQRTILDVVIIGGGNAALCAALMAREAGASVLMLEASPRDWRGGNTQHTRNLRCMHDRPQDVLVEAYPGSTCFESGRRFGKCNVDLRWEFQHVELNWPPSTEMAW